MVSYDKQTLNTPNPIARYAHRNRLARVIKLVTSQAKINKVLDYGCGSGAFLKAIKDTINIEVVGYEPHMTERVDTTVPIYDKYESIDTLKPFDLITIFETVEHLSEDELLTFLTRADSLMGNGGRILFSAPIEIGPAILMKELNRCILHKRLPENKLLELLLASIFGISAKRSINIKNSHKGFDFRKTIKYLEETYGPVTIESYGPLPIPTWYGNSQIYFWLEKRIE